MNICVLGCGGFIGSHFVERVLNQTSWSLSGVDLSSHKIDHLLPHPRFQFIKGDAYRESLPRWIKSSDVVVSLTAICNPDYYNKQALKVIEANFLQPFEIARLCTKEKKWLIQFSSSEVYGKSPAALNAKQPHPFSMDEESSHLILGPVAKQRWSYSCAKQLLERAIYALGTEQGLAYTIIRPFNFIGPRMDFIPGIDGEGVPRVLACFMSSLLLNRPLQLVNKGVSKRVFTSVDDGMDALMAVLARPQASAQKIFNIGNPANEVSIAQLAGKMLALYPKVSGKSIGSRCILKDVSSEEFYGPGYDDSDRRLPDISLAEKLLEWEPKVDLEAALIHSMRAYLAHYAQGAMNLA